MQVFLAVLSFIDIVALTFLNGYWVRSSSFTKRCEELRALKWVSLLSLTTGTHSCCVCPCVCGGMQLITLDELELDHLNPADVAKRLNKLVCT